MKASPLLLSKTELFQTWRQQSAAFVFFILLFCLSLFSEYQQYKKLTQFDEYISTAWVEKQYRKNEHWVLKLQSTEGFSFYTTSKEDLKPLDGYFVQVKLFTDRITFFSFLKGFYAHSRIDYRLEKKQERYRLMHQLDDVHGERTAPLFKALFLAGPIPKSLRDKLSAWGINHLLAISGFHLGVLGFIVFFILNTLYRPVQNQFFPYRHARKDIALTVTVLLFGYLYFLDFVPSLLRAFSMSVFAYILYDRGIKILSFSSLFIVVSFLIAMWPKLLFALGFWFSVAGVFFIFLFLHHLKELKPWQSFLLLHIWVYLAMLPLVHYFYGTFSLYQLYSPLLTMLFIVFYPLELFIHVITEGARLDFVLEWFLNIKTKTIEVILPLWALLIYLILSLLSIFDRRFFYLLLFLCMTTLGYFLYRIA